VRSLTDSDFLDLWEGGFRRHPLDRALLILGAAFPETPYERLAEWHLGRRNKALAELRAAYFGRSLKGWVLCTNCGEKLEFELDGQVIAGEAMEDDETGHSEEPIVVNGRSFRLPTSRDLAEAAQETDPRLAAIRIVKNCLIGPEDSPTQSEENWSEEDLEKIGETMAAADPMAETLLALRCSNCGSESQETLDLVSFLWAEIEARARRLLLQVHALASAYGWSEAEILSLSENRRSNYFALVQS
jgi:hypothetical protein